MTPKFPGSLLSFPPLLQLFMSSYQTRRVLPNPPEGVWKRWHDSRLALVWFNMPNRPSTRELPLMILAGIGSFFAHGPRLGGQFCTQSNDNRSRTLDPPAIPGVFCGRTLQG